MLFVIFVIFVGTFRPKGNSEDAFHDGNQHGVGKDRTDALGWRTGETLEIRVAGNGDSRSAGSVKLKKSGENRFKTELSVGEVGVTQNVNDGDTPQTDESDSNTMLTTNRSDDLTVQLFVPKNDPQTAKHLQQFFAAQFFPAMGRESYYPPGMAVVATEDGNTGSNEGCNSNPHGDDVVDVDGNSDESEDNEDHEKEHKSGTNKEAAKSPENIANITSNSCHDRSLPVVAIEYGERSSSGDGNRAVNALHWTGLREHLKPVRSKPYTLQNQILSKIIRL